MCFREFTPHQLVGWCSLCPECTSFYTRASRFIVTNIFSTKFACWSTCHANVQDSMYRYMYIYMTACIVRGMTLYAADAVTSRGVSRMTTKGGGGAQLVFLPLLIRAQQGTSLYPMSYQWQMTTKHPEYATDCSSRQCDCRWYVLSACRDLWLGDCLQGRWPLIVIRGCPQVFSQSIVASYLGGRVWFSYGVTKNIEMCMLTCTCTHSTG